MPKFQIATFWTVSAIVEIEASTLQDAIDIVDPKKKGGLDSLPDDWEYVDESFQINHEWTEELNE